MTSKLFGSVVIVLTGAVVAALGEDTAALQKKLVGEYALTQPTAANDDIVTAGAILVLQKSDLVLGPTSASSLYTNVYKDGKIEANSFAQAKKTLGKIGRFGSFIPGVGGTAAASGASTADSSSGAAPRTYVKGEKIWVTKIELKTENKQPEVVFELFTDAVNDVRYKGALKFPYSKGASDEDVDKLVAEVFKVQPADQDQQAQAPAAGQAAAPAAAPAPAADAPPAAAAAPAPAAALPDVPPPPPPADEPAAPPKTISVGQTPEQVTAAMGQPDKIVKLGKKEIYYYKDLKVIFMAGKVSDVQ